MAPNHSVPRHFSVPHRSSSAIDQRGVHCQLACKFRTNRKPHCRSIAATSPEMASHPAFLSTFRMYTRHYSIRPIRKQTLQRVMVLPRHERDAETTAHPIQPSLFYGHTPTARLGQASCVQGCFRLERALPMSRALATLSVRASVGQSGKAAHEPRTP